MTDTFPSLIICFFCLPGSWSAFYFVHSSCFPSFPPVIINGNIGSRLSRIMESKVNLNSAAGIMNIPGKLQYVIKNYVYCTFQQTDHLYFKDIKDELWGMILVSAASIILETLFFFSEFRNQGTWLLTHHFCSLSVVSSTFYFQII